ncbi:MAG: hypothetical protein EOO41_03125 [Methanobacteriota archaeon]|nr:MAG: hypothetical protein EOO41_03125 [Euryarchaeota archaeon]
MHTTDAASWGAFDVARGTWSLPAIASIDPRIVDWLPARLVQSVQPVGMLQLHAMDAAFPRWAALLRGAATDAAASSATSPPTRRSPPALAAHVYCSVGDHAAAVFGTLCVSARPQGEVPPTGTQPVSILPLARLSQTWQQVLVVTLGTSAQVATVARAPLPGAPTPDGVDVRPFLTRAARVCADAEGWALHVAAAMNGGNVLAHVADAAVTAGVAPTRAAAYAYLEAAAHEELERRPADAIVRIVAAAAGSEVRFGSVGGSVGGSVCEDSCASAAAHGALTPCATSLLPPQGMRINSSQLLFVGTRCTRLPFRERNAAGGDCDVKHSSEPAPSTHEQLSPEQLGSVRAVAQSLGLCFHSCSVADDDVERAAAHSTEDDTTRKLWARAYVAAAGAMLWNTCALLPSTYWRTCEHVIAAGAAFDKSATLRALLRALLSAECVRWLMAEPGTADRASPSLIWAPPEYVATAGAIGPLAAVLACAEVPGVGA